MFWLIYYLNFLSFLYVARKNKLFIRFLLLVLIFFMGQRWMTGEDFPGYLLYYLIDFKGVDFGFFALQGVFLNNEFSFSLFVFFTYLLTIFLTYKFIGLFSNSALIFVFFTITELFFIQLSQIKQSLAIPIFLFSFYFLYNNRKFFGFCTFFLASSIHIATLFLIPFLFFKVSVQKKYLNIFLVLVCFLPLINITSLLPSVLYFKYAHYLTSDYNQPLSVFHYFKFYTVVFLFFLLCQANSEFNLLRNKFAITGFIFYLFIYAISFQFAPLMRLSYFFRIFEVVVFINLSLSLNQWKIFLFIVFLFYSVSFVFISIIDPYNVSRYQFNFIKIYENKTDSELYSEIDNFYKE